jgi:hypothetical protein
MLKPGDELDTDENDNVKNSKNLNQASLFNKFKSKMGFANTQQQQPVDDDVGNKKRIDENDGEIDVHDDGDVFESRKNSVEELKQRSYSDLKRDFQLGDIMDFVHKGIDTIIDDDVTKRFTTEGIF